MKRVLDASRSMSLLAVVTLAADAVGAFVLGTARTLDQHIHPFERAGKPRRFSHVLVAPMDRFLLASALLRFADGLYGLCLGGLNVPAWLEIRKLRDLKTRPVRGVIEVMPVTPHELLFGRTDPRNRVSFAGALAQVSTVGWLGAIWREGAALAIFRRAPADPGSGKRGV